MRADQGTLESDARCDCASINEKAMETSLTTRFDGFDPTSARTALAREERGNGNPHDECFAIFGFFLCAWIWCGLPAALPRTERLQKHTRETPRRLLSHVRSNVNNAKEKVTETRMTNVPSASARHASVPRAFPTRIARMPSAVSCNDFFCPYTHKTRTYTTSSAWPCAFNSARFGLTHGPSHHVPFVVKRWTRFVTLVLFFGVHIACLVVNSVVCSARTHVLPTTHASPSYVLFCVFLFVQLACF